MKSLGMIMLFWTYANVGVIGGRSWRTKRIHIYQMDKINVITEPFVPSNIAQVSKRVPSGGVLPGTLMMHDYNACELYYQIQFKIFS
jgi:hypothetical protein